MCGRYTQTASVKELKARFGFKEPEFDLKPRYNLAPSQDAPVVVEQDGRRLELFHWGLIPSWAKEAKTDYSMINARAETIMEKPSYKRPLQNSRCLVIADSFYEWRKVTGGKTPMRVVLPSREPFAMAGLWDTWKGPDGKATRSFTIITTSANDAMRPIHDRMPVILRHEDEDQWLDPKATPDDLLRLLRPWPGELAPYEVSKLVNVSKNDVSACIEAATS